MTMKDLLKIAFLSVMSLTLTGCFEVEEKVRFNSDYSGTFSLTIDMGQMKEMMLSMGINLDEMEENPFEDMENDFAEQRDKMNGLEGVSNARLVSDDENYVISMLLDFEDVDALNRVMNESFNNEVENAKPIVYYKKTRNGIERTDAFEHGYQMKAELENSEDLQGMDPAAIFSDLSYKVTMEFERSIRSTSNGDYQISEGENAVSLQYYFFQPASEGMTLENSVSF